MNTVSYKLIGLIKACFVLVLLCSSTTVFAIDEKAVKAFSDSEQSYRSPLLPLRYAQSRNSNGSNTALRSKSEVMEEVKRRYGGQVLRISLNQQSASYSVRVLLPDGKVRNLQVSARR